MNSNTITSTLRNTISRRAAATAASMLILSGSICSALYPIPTGAELRSFMAFAPTFTGGVFVSTVAPMPHPPLPHPILTTIWTGGRTGGDPVPGAGTDTRIPADATFLKFGVPSVNSFGERAFLAQWISQEGKGGGIFSGNLEALAIAIGDAASGTSGLFSALRDPMYNYYGEIAFIGKVKGAGVTPANDTGIWSSLFEALPKDAYLVAREGHEAPGVDGATFKSFKSVALGDDGLAFTAFMNLGDGVTKDNDMGLWIDAGEGPNLVLREGQVLPEGTVKKITALLPGSLSRGHGHGVGGGGGEVLLGVDEDFGDIVTPFDAAVVNVRVQFTDGTQALYQANPFGVIPIAKTGDHAAGHGPGVTYEKFGIPGSASSGSFAFLSKSKGPGVTGANGTSVHFWDSFDIFEALRKGDEADLLGDTFFKAFKDPVANSLGDILIPAKITGLGVSKDNDEGLWWTSPFFGLFPVALEGGVAPGTLDEGAGGGEGEHAEFGKFKSIAMPEFGLPVFVAKLKTGPGGAPGPGNTTTANDDGAWATSPLGFPQLIIREGQQYDGKTVKKFALLASVPGSMSQTRAHNDNGHLIMRVDFTDGSQAIVDVELPGSGTPSLE